MPKSRAYPVPVYGGNDPRFTLGFTLDVIAVLEKHGFPSVEGDDFVELQQALYRFCYRPSYMQQLEERSAAQADTTGVR